MENNIEFSKPKNKYYSIENTIFKEMYRYKLLYIMLLPVIVCVIVFQYIPMVYIIAAFQDFNPFAGKLTGSPFVGFKHFENIFKIPEFKAALWNSLFFGIATIGILFPCPIILALMFNEMRSKLFKRVSQTVSYLPYFISWAVVTGISYQVFSTEGTFNDLRTILYGAGLEPKNFMIDPKYFLFFMCFTTVWKNVGWNSVIFLSAITGIDAQLYEAARIDGCSKFKQLLHITLPGILPTTMIVFILSAGGILNTNFEQIYGLQNIYTQPSTDVINTIIYRYGITMGQYSPTIAFGLFQGVVGFVLVFAANKLARRISEVGIF